MRVSVFVCARACIRACEGGRGIDMFGSAWYLCVAAGRGGSKGWSRTAVCVCVVDTTAAVNGEADARQSTQCLDVVTSLHFTLAMPAMTRENLL